MHRSWQLQLSRQTSDRVRRAAQSGGAKVQVTDHRSGHRLQATGQVTGHRPQVRLQVRSQVKHKNNKTLDKTVLD